MTIPRINSYGNYSSDNYGAHCLCVEVGPLTVWFSYKTPVAFEISGQNRVVRSNSWGPTTGKHLNAIDGGSRQAHKARVSGLEFERLWSEQVTKMISST